ncbi:questin oxidase family protein [Pleionea sp. CnH1-48]|uniref:questin oxidase family protein n=1 Tax=Pleionea sp. CnH1-48 TaxID=2954494 RepID=UPI002098115A|nr:questin oxidase family protein [Pleionea sp. CnH1-48]MCO7226394.1 questin oxidase family protein [Pleionea sp. CnH1-48]
MPNDTQLINLLEQAGKYHPHYGDRLATHLPMVLLALHRLGATDERLQSIFDKSIKGLALVDEKEADFVIESLNKHLSRSGAYTNYLKYYKQQINSLGFEAVLRQSLPILLPGIAASAFHALIRLAYAIDAGNEGEMAIALAYWSAEFQPFELCNDKTEETLEDILIRLAPIGVKHSFSPGIIIDRMNEVGNLLKQDAVVFQPQDITFASLRKLCLKAFYLQNDFTLLHTVTGCHAFSTILQYIDDESLALRELWKAIVVAYLSTGLPFDNKEVEPEVQDCDFDSIIKKALASTDSHQIKLVYSCLSEYSKYGDSLYYLIARRAVKIDEE